MLIGRSRRVARFDARSQSVALSFDGTEYLSSSVVAPIGTANNWSILVTAKATNTAALQTYPLLWCNTGVNDATEILVSRIIGGTVGEEVMSVAARGDVLGDLIAYRWNNPYLPINNWRTHAFTFGGGTNLLGYIDGTLRSPDAIVSNDSVTQSDASRLVMLAANDSGLSFWEGNIYQFAMWNRVLSAGEIAQMCASPTAGMVESGLVHWWRFGLPTVGNMAGTTYICDAVPSGGIDVSTAAVNMSNADIVSDSP